MRQINWAEDLLQRWGEYVRGLREVQGTLHRCRDLIEAADAIAIRMPGSHSDPTLANIIAEERAGLSFISSLDFCIVQYPLVWLRMIVPRYVGVPADDGWQLMGWAEIDAAVGLPERDRKACMKQIREQIEMDARRIIEQAKASRRAA